MRTVAVFLALLTVIPLMPTSVAADECANPGAASFCIPIELTRPTPPPGVPALPPSQVWDKYYVWIGVGHCLPNPNTQDCRAVPAVDGSGIPDPAPCVPVGDLCVGSMPPGVGVFGMVFQESNGMAGLQRTQTTRPPDIMVLL